MTWLVRPERALDDGYEMEECEESIADYFGLYYFDPRWTPGDAGGPTMWQADFAHKHVAEWTANLLNMGGLKP